MVIRASTTIRTLRVRDTKILENNLISRIAIENGCKLRNLIKVESLMMMGRRVEVVDGH